MSTGEEKLVVSLQKFSIGNERRGEMDLDTVSLSDEDALLETSVEKEQPTNSDLMKFLEQMNANLASNNVFKAAATKRLNELDAKVGGNTDKILKLESHLVELSTSQPHTEGWSEQRKLRNNINIIGVYG